MLSSLAEVFSSPGFEPHGHCFLWTRGLVALYTASDSVIALSYYAIPLALVQFVRKRKDLAFGWVFLMFSAFILACGTTHLLGIVTLWEPVYWLDGTVKALTAALSLATAVTLYPLIPRALSLPSHAQLDAANRELREEVRERRAAQEALVAAQEELVRHERLSTVGQLAASMSHELRNPLGVIRNSVYYLNMVLPEDPKVRKHLGILDREVNAATSIITGLLDFTRVRPAVRVETDLAALVREEMDRVVSPDGVRRVLRMDDHLPKLRIDPDQVRLILGNPVSNAIQAMPGGGELTVTVACVDGEAAAVTVADTGDGIPVENLEKIFEPLFTTKARGIGIGLALARRLAEANGASITVQSTPGQGSRFTVRFGGDGRAP